MPSLLRSLALLTVPFAAAALGISLSSPPRVLHFGETIDRVLAGSVDLWLGEDTLHLVSPRNWIFAEHFTDYVTQQPRERGRWRGVDFAIEPADPPAAEAGSPIAPDGHPGGEI